MGAVRSVGRWSITGHKREKAREGGGKGFDKGRGQGRRDISEGYCQGGLIVLMMR